MPMSMPVHCHVCVRLSTCAHVRGQELVAAAGALTALAASVQPALLALPTPAPAPARALHVRTDAADDVIVRRCLSCGTSETPKWRCRMTMCNACGLRMANRGSASFICQHTPASEGC